MGENGSETKVHRELTRKKNGTYFWGKTSEPGFGAIL